jgi:hypothetical protein
VRGVEYKIDLNAKNVAALEKALERYIAVAHPVVQQRAGRARRQEAAPNEDVALIREWAIASDYAVSSRGRIPTEVRAA